jgi:hypothetical protein
MREALCFLPSCLGNSYAMAAVEDGWLKYDLRKAMLEVSRRMEACRLLEVQPFLDKDHDYHSQLFMLENFYLVESQGIFCSGRWTEEGLKLRPSFCGVSQSCVSYCEEYPPPQKYLKAKKRQVEELDKTLIDPDFFGSLGCCCIDKPPTFPATIKTIGLDGAADDLVRLITAFNSAKISWPLPTLNTNKSQHEVTTNEPTLGN